MRWTSTLPLIALAASVLLTLGLASPLVVAAPHLVDAANIRVIAAAADLRPRHRIEGEIVASLAAAGALGSSRARQYGAVFDRTAAPSGGIGLLALPVPDKARGFINGLRVQDQSPSRRGDTFIAEIRRDGLQDGLNEASILAQAGPFRWPRAIFIGPIAQLKAAAARIILIERWTLAATGILGSAGALLGFLLVVGKDERRPLIAPALLALTIAGAAAASWFETPTLALTPWVWTRLMLNAGSACLVLLMTSSEKDEWARWTTIGFRVCVVATVAVAASGPISRWSSEAAVFLARWAALVAGLAGAGGGLILVVAGRGVREALSPARRSILALAALSILAATAARAEALGPWGLLLGQSLAGLSASLFATMWLVWVAARAFVDSEMALQKRLSLSVVVREQQARIAAQQAALEEEISRRAVLEERERLSRDIHDGVGGSLASLLLQARTGDLKDDDLEAGLERSLEDLRLMIDALDHAPAGLSTAFSTLQTRISPAFRAAGIDLDWRQERLEGRALKDSRALLQVFRILQEATTNAMRHSNATLTCVTIGWDDDRNVLMAEVQDNGNGMTRASPRQGKGLRNMAERAQRIGGELSVGRRTDGPGWRVCLEVPGV